MNCKIAVVGKLGVGKSAFVCRLLTKRFIHEYDPTIEGTYIRKIVHDGKELGINVTDTICSAMPDIIKVIEMSDIIFLVYSVVDESSLQ